MIVIVAPYSPPNRTGVTHLGAARKIEAVVEILSRVDAHIVFINTAHHSKSRSPLSSAQLSIGGVDVTELTPPTFANRRIGKLLNILNTAEVVAAVLKFGEPQLVWLYNGYAFESKFGQLMKKKLGCPLILELEDWHFSRGRGFNPKPFFDWVYWRAVMPYISYAFVVNSSLANRLGGLSDVVGLFPGVVAEGIREICETSSPFATGDNFVVVGYFGGLSVEKGAHWVAKLVPQLPLNFRMIVTGSGELDDSFVQLANCYPAQLDFRGRVDDATLLHLIGSCDVLLNPHAPIDAMSDGIFPFKVIEGVASGRLMISTKLPSAGLEDVLQGVVLIEHSFQNLLDAVLNSKEIYESNLTSIQDGAALAINLFGKDAIQNTINRVCGGKKF